MKNAASLALHRRPAPARRPADPPPTWPPTSVAMRRIPPQTDPAAGRSATALWCPAVTSDRRQLLRAADSGRSAGVRCAPPGGWDQGSRRSGGQAFGGGGRFRCRWGSSGRRRLGPAAQWSSSRWPFEPSDRRSLGRSRRPCCTEDRLPSVSSRRCPTEGVDWMSERSGAGCHANPIPDCVPKREKVLFYRKQLEGSNDDTHFASNASAIMPAASGADADVPVCRTVHALFTSVDATIGSPAAPDEYVTARIAEHRSPYQGTRPHRLALPIVTVNRLPAYPSQLQLSPTRPPFPLAHTNTEPRPSLPRRTPRSNASCANRPGRSNAQPLSGGPHDALYTSTRRQAWPSAIASTTSKTGPPSSLMPPMRALNATPTPHLPLLAAIAISPAQRVPCDDSLVGWSGRGSGRSLFTS